MMKKKLSTICVILLFLLCLQKGLSVSKNFDNEYLKNKEYVVSQLGWKLWGYRPESWKMDFNFTDLNGPKAEYGNIPVKVPGSVQKALKDAGLIPDWNIGNNYSMIEWIENRHWIFGAEIPDAWVSQERIIILHCPGLDGNGVIMVNGEEAGKFHNTFIPYRFNITPFLKDNNNTLAVVFECPPAYLGQIGYTSKIKDWKPRFYYGWDWIPRMVQIGIVDDILLEVLDNDHSAIEYISVTTDTDRIKDIGNLSVSAEVTPKAIYGKARIQLIKPDKEALFDETFPAIQLCQGKAWNNLNIRRWWPNGSGEQPLYRLLCTLYDADGTICQRIERKIGFKNIEWLPCKNALPEADPWICSVNNMPIFLQGVNWTPIRPNFADLKESDYRKLIRTYKNLGVNIFRVWGGGIPEKKWFYDICDEMGILVWQDFPLSSSGLDNYPPDTPEEILVMSRITESYIRRLRHHVSLLLWCGGNELSDYDNEIPVNDRHPMIRSIKKMVMAEDPDRRFIATSPSGPTISGGLHNFGKGVNWHVHGPWKLPFTASDRTMKAVKNYWELDDALMRSEVGVQGAMSAEMINKYRGELPSLPANMQNPLWRQVSWWIEWDEYLDDHAGKAPESLEEYVSWSQERQTSGLSIALQANKSRFPECGGFIIWMGHDSYPCPVNLSIIDFDGNPKPVALELSKIWKSNK